MKELKPLDFKRIFLDKQTLLVNQKWLNYFTFLTYSSVP